MATQASNSYLSLIQLKRFLALLIILQASLAGCRGPWFKRTDNFEPLVVNEKAEPRSPRAFASSRLRPTTPSESSASVPRPSGQTRSISDSNAEGIAANIADNDVESNQVADDSSLPAALRSLGQRQINAMKNQPSRDLLETVEVEPGAAPPWGSSEARFNLSDNDESEVEAQDTAAPQPSTKQVASNKVDSKKANERHVAADTAPRKQPKGEDVQLAPLNEQEPANNNSANKNPASKNVVSASADSTDAGGGARTAIAIETSKSDWRLLAQEAIAAMQAELENSPNQTDSQKLAIESKIRMMNLVIDDLDGAMTPIEFLEPNARDYYINQMQALHSFIDPSGNPVMSRRWTIALQSQRKAQNHLAAISNLEVQNVAFCTEVDSFGIISRFPKYHFKPDQELLLYCELDNFISEKLKNEYETKLQGSYEIVDKSGKRVTDQLLPPDEHICSNHRRDYFIAYRIFMPKEIPTGSYTLKLTIEDMKGRKFGQSSIDFQIVE